MRVNASTKEDNSTCGEGSYCVKLYSRRAALISEFCLNAKENNLQDLKAAKEFLFEAMPPCDFASTTITLISDEGSDDQSTLQFDLKPA